VFEVECNECCVRYIQSQSRVSSRGSGVIIIYCAELVKAITLFQRHDLSESHASVFSRRMIGIPEG